MMIQIAGYLPPQPTPLWAMVRHAGVRHAVGGLPYGETVAQDPRDYMAMLRLKTGYADAGFTLSVIESSPPMEKIRLDLDGRDEEIDYFCDFVTNMGAPGIPVVCYNFMAVMGWGRTSTTTPSGGGALVSGYDHALMRNAPPTEWGEVSEDQLWENVRYFLQRVLPVAERVNVKLALHPDDPPLSPIRGMGRIMRSNDNFQHVPDMADSPSNSITFCQGNFALMTNDLPAAIRHFGR